MDETDDHRDRTGTAESGGVDERPDAAAGDGRTRHDRETVESAVQEIEGVEYESGNVAGASPASDLGPVEPESPTLEGTLFVLLGVVLTLVVLAQLVGL